MDPLDSSPGPRRYDFALLILANVIWGSTDVAAKCAVAELSPAQTAWLRFTVALLVFAPVLIRRRAEVPRTIRGLAPFLFLGACGFYLNFVLHYHGLTLAPASHATALRVSEALAILVLSAVFLREKIGVRAVAGLVAGTAGVALVLDLHLGELDLFAGGRRLGDLLILAGILVEGLYTVGGKKALQGTRPLTATALACVMGWLLLTVTSLTEIRELAIRPPSWKALLACAYLGVFATALGYSIWYRALARRDSHRVGMTIMVQPLVGVPLAAVVLHEAVGPSFLAGAVLIAAGVYLAVSSGAVASEAPPS